jgi:hypothetical protein
MFLLLPEQPTIKTSETLIVTASHSKTSLRPDASV